MLCIRSWNLPGLAKLASLPLASTFPEPDADVEAAPQASEALRDFLVSNSRNKIHQTAYKDFLWALYNG